MGTSWMFSQIANEMDYFGFLPQLFGMVKISAKGIMTLGEQE